MNREVIEACRQRAVVLFQSYAQGVALNHGRSEDQLISDVNSFAQELTEAYQPLLDKLDAQAGGWLPIASAPKNTPLIITNSEQATYAALEETDYGGTYWASHYGEAVEWEPTHWAWPPDTLPPPPTAMRGEGL